MKSLKITQKMIDDLESYGFACPNGKILYGYSAVTKYVYTYNNKSPYHANVGFGRAVLNRLIEKHGDLTLPEFKQIAFSTR